MVRGEKTELSGDLDSSLFCKMGTVIVIHVHLLDRIVIRVTGLMSVKAICKLYSAINAHKCHCVSQQVESSQSWLCL